MEARFRNKTGDSDSNYVTVSFNKGVGVSGRLKKIHPGRGLWLSVYTRCETVAPSCVVRAEGRVRLITFRLMRLLSRVSEDPRSLLLSLSAAATSQVCENMLTPIS